MLLIYLKASNYPLKTNNHEKSIFKPINFIRHTKF